MDIAQLEYFKVIAETGSLTKAAEILHVSQPAMSVMLKRFEEEMQAELFDRTPNRIHLNSTGEIALLHVNGILKRVEDMQADVQAAARENLTLRAGFCDPGVQWFTIPRFCVANPEIQLLDNSFYEKDFAAKLKEREYDLIITPEKISAEGIESIPFLPDQVYLSVPQENRLAQYQKLSLKDIPRQPLLFPQIGGYFLEAIDTIVQKNNLPIQLVKNELNTTQYLIRSTNFLTTISRLSSDLRNDGTNRVRIPLSDPELNVMYYVSYLKSNRQKVKPFLAWAKSVREELEKEDMHETVA